MHMLLKVVRRAIGGFIAHDVLTLAAALAFYTLVSFAPLMVLVLWAAATVGPGMQDLFLTEFATLAGNDARLAALAVIEGVKDQPALGNVARIVGVGVVLFGSTTVFAQLQASLNTIWDLDHPPASAVWGWLRRRILSAGVLGAIAFVLIVSTLVNSGLGVLLSQTGLLWKLVDETVTTLVFGVLFAALFRYLPDARLPWKRALAGGLLSAVLFGVGKWAIGYFLVRGKISDAYGAAGSLVVLLLWVYYSASVFFFSAELLEAWIVEHGGKINPLVPMRDVPATPPNATAAIVGAAPPMPSPRPTPPPSPAQLAQNRPPTA